MAEQIKGVSDLEKLVKKKNLNSAEIAAIMDQIKNPEYDKITKVKHDWGTKHIRIGLHGDTHIGSKYTNNDVRNDLFKRFKKEGVDVVYLTGDITEGYNMRGGHSFEVSHHGADEQAKQVIDTMPFINKPIYFINGDHDHSHFKSAGVDIGKVIENDRKDMHYLGFFSSIIKLSPKITLELSHPGKGTAYALSYHPQKMAEAFTGGEKPNILGIGHYHKAEYLFYRNIHIFQTGTSQNQSPWMRRMNLSAHLGGWLLDIYMKEDGSIDKLTQTFFPYYK